MALNKTEVKRRKFVEVLADHLLAEGLGQSSLRQMARAAGTSDRMLLHYFTNKDELLTAVLLRVTERLKILLEATRREPMPFPDLIRYLSDRIKDPTVRPFLRLWLELAASAADGEASYRLMARQIMDNFFEWVQTALHVDNEVDRLPMAALALATAEGFAVLDIVDSNHLIQHALKAIEIPGKPTRPLAGRSITSPEPHTPEYWK